MNHIGAVQTAMRRNFSPPLVLETNANHSPFELNSMDDKNVLFLIGPAKTRTLVPWNVLEGIPEFLKNNGTVQLSAGGYDVMGVDGTLDAYLKRSGGPKRNIQNYIAKTLEQARIVEFASSQPEAIRLTKSFETELANIPLPVLNLVPQHTYRRRDLHALYGGQRQGGIATPAGEPLLMLFTGSAGMQHGYSDGWTDDDVFEYFGEGQIGDMEFVRGNGAIRRHIENGKSLLLFQSVRKAFVRFVGEMTYVGHRISQAPDTEGNQRDAIIFQLAPTDTLNESPEIDEEEALPTDLDELRKLALADSANARTPKERLTKVRRRSVAVKEYARARSGGSCEGCALPAPFTTTAGAPYLEVHHVHRLSDGGPDRPDAVVAICPNCHRRVHHGIDGKEYNSGLAKIAEDLESANQ